MQYFPTTSILSELSCILCDMYRTFTPLLVRFNVLHEDFIVLRRHVPYEYIVIWSSNKIECSTLVLKGHFCKFTLQTKTNIKI